MYARFTSAAAGLYGAPRIHAELAAEGTQVSRKRVARVMREAGLCGVSRRKGPRTTRRDPQARPAPDLVERRFDGPDLLWVAENALFAGHDEGAAAWGRIATLIETCKMNGVEPYAWLKSTLEKIAAGHPQSRIRELLPWNFDPALS